MLNFQWVTQESARDDFTVRRPSAGRRSSEASLGSRGGAGGFKYNHHTVGGLMASSSRLHKDTPPRSGAPDERSALLQRVMWSRQIEKSVRIRDFLVYVCE